MAFAPRTGSCPNCGGPIEFKLGSSAALVCPWCRFSVIRTDRDLQAIGKISDLVPTAPEMTVGDTGSVFGRNFLVGGRIQYDHGQGPWDEWYVSFDDGTWAWIAKAQGRYFLTYPVQSGSLPPIDAMRVGARGELPSAGPGPFTAAEVGTRRTVSAEGELPFPTRSGEVERYVDLSGASGEFATIDYGDGSSEPVLYAGKTVPHESIELRGGGGGPRPDEKLDLSRLRCPQCGAPVHIFVPSQVERVTCAACNALLDPTGKDLKWLAQLEPGPARPLQIGAQATLRGVDMLVIGVMDRSTEVEGVEYWWTEYLVHTPEGFMFLVEENGHWVLVRTVPPGSVRADSDSATWNGTSDSKSGSGRGEHKLKLFGRITARVRYVRGEFYWRVHQNDVTFNRDFIAPGMVLSEERSENEITFSVGEYVPTDEVGAAFKITLPKPWGVASSQPNPHKQGLMWLMCLGLAGLLIAVSVIFSVGRKRTLAFDGPIAVASLPAAASGEGPTAVSVSEPFLIEGRRTTMKVKLNTDLANGWMAVGVALIDRKTNDVQQFFVQNEYYSGYEGGEHWTEGDNDSAEYIGDVMPGEYTLRFESIWGENGMRPPLAKVEVTTGDRSMWCFFCTLLLLFIPPIGSSIFRYSFESKRWENSTEGNPYSSSNDDD